MGPQRAGFLNPLSEGFLWNIKYSKPVVWASMVMVEMTDSVIILKADPPWLTEAETETCQ